MLTSAIEQSAANPILCQEALKQAANEKAQAQTIGEPTAIVHKLRNLNKKINER